MSIAIEAAELMEHFQWDAYSIQDQEKIAQELAAVVVYCLSFASVMNIDITQAFQKKLAINRQKYPTEVFHDGRDHAADYLRAKQKIKKAS